MITLVIVQQTSSPRESKSTPITDVEHGKPTKATQANADPPLTLGKVALQEQRIWMSILLSLIYYISLVGLTCLFDWTLALGSMSGRCAAYIVASATLPPLRAIWTHASIMYKPLGLSELLTRLTRTFSESYHRALLPPALAYAGSQALVVVTWLST